ncbi:MAG: helix-turn-helix transcriptional regulator [Aminivibrio sp.]|jgi:transcriptional regulator with XRE-family HTH domain
MKTTLFAKRLKECRDLRGLSQEALGKAVDMSRFSVIEWEASRQVPNAMVAAKIAEVLKVSLDYLLGRDDLKKEGSKGDIKHYRLLPDGSFVPVDLTTGSLEEVLAENPDLEVWFRTRKLSKEEKSQIAALLLQIKERWDAEEQSGE